PEPLQGTRLPSGIPHGNWSTRVGNEKSIVVASEAEYGVAKVRREIFSVRGSTHDKYRKRCALNSLKKHLEFLIGSIRGERPCQHRKDRRALAQLLHQIRKRLLTGRVRFIDVDFSGDCHQVRR